MNTKTHQSEYFRNFTPELFAIYNDAALDLEQLKRDDMPENMTDAECAMERSGERVKQMWVKQGTTARSSRKANGMTGKYTRKCRAWSKARHKVRLRDRRFKHKVVYRKVRT